MNRFIAVLFQTHIKFRVNDVSEEVPYLMVLKGSQILDLAPDGTGRAGLLAPIVGIQGITYTLTSVSFLRYNNFFSNDLRK